MVLDFGLLNSTLFPASAAAGEGLGSTDDMEAIRVDNDTAAGTTTYYYTICGQKFRQQAGANRVNVGISGVGGMLNSELGRTASFYAGVSLPNGATITGVIVYGTFKVWELRRSKLSDVTGGTIATADDDVEDTTITTPIIDNESYCYIFRVVNLEVNEHIYGARITYTL